MTHFQLLQHYLNLVQPYLQSYGYSALFLGVLFEGFGIPAPGQTLIIASALLAGRGEMSLSAVLFVGWTAASLGNCIGYGIGRIGGRRLILRYADSHGMYASWLKKVELVFSRWGGAIVIIARFIDVLRQLNGIVAGTSFMPWWKFLGYNTLGAALWVGLWGAASYYLGEHIGVVLLHFKRVEPYVIGMLLLGLILGIVFWRYNGHSRV